MTETYKESLRNGAAFVRFIKSDGTERTMVCTTDMSLIPADKHPKGTADMKTASPPDIIRAFDLEIGQWRSFSVHTLIEFLPSAVDLRKVG